LPRGARIIVALLALLALVAVVAGCGGGVPADSVARVGGSSIKKASFEHWLGVASASAQQGGAGPAAVPDPPTYQKCIAAQRKALPTPAKGQPKVTDAQLKSQCEQQYSMLRDQVVQFLISAQWIEGQAKDMGIKLSDADVKKEFDKQKKQSFPKEADFQRFLKQSGMTMEDVLFRVRLDNLSNKIRTDVTKGSDKVTQAQIADYYNKNKERFAQPERRDVGIVLTKTEAQANEAKAAIQGGQSLASVAKKMSIDTASKDHGGVLNGVAKGTQEKALDDAIFSAKKGQLQGPVKTQFGWYVFQVNSITAATQQTLAQATPTIRQLLISQNQQQSLDKFIKDFQKKWKDKTECRKGFVVPDCKNAPKPKTTSTGAPAGQGTTTTP
jgi:foldase protein PrsA